MDVKVNPHVTVTLAGATAQVSPTTELNPFNEVTVIVEVVEFPTVVVAETGDALKLKLLTVNPYVVVRVWPSPFPLTVMA
jgi:hypothetical protein